jgi:FKBP-type peptidyl-prolyl cis-trans isomerase
MLKTLLFTGVACAIAISIAGAAEQANQPPKKVEDKTAYAAGFDVGLKLKELMERHNLTADDEQIVKGLIDGLKGNKPPYPADELESEIARIEMIVRSERVKMLMASDPSIKKLAEDNLARSEKFLKEHAMLEGVETLPNGIQVKVLKAGDGKIIANAKWITAKFEISLADGTVVHAMDEAGPKKVACGRLSPAVLEAIRTMPVGARWRVAVPPEHAYGVAGKPPLFGPNQALMIEVELLGVE